MKDNTVPIDLHSVPQTLLVPLVSRAFASQYSKSSLADEKAVQIVKALKYDFNQLIQKSGKSVIIWGIARSFHFDQAIKIYLKTYPNGTIVDLGAGLETTFYRVDNGRLTWINLDLPEVIALRQALLPKNERVKSINKSVFDFSWMEDIQATRSPLLFLAGGLFIYFEEKKLIELFNAISNHFPHSEIIFDAISPRFLKSGNRSLDKMGMSDARLQWGIQSLNKVQSWSSHIKTISRVPYFKDINTYYAFPFMYRALMFVFDALNGDGGIIQIQFE